MLAQALAQRGLRVAIIVFGDAPDLPEAIETVRILPRPGYTQPRNAFDRVVEIFRVWTSLARAPSRAIVYRTGGLEVGLIAVYARLARRRLVFATANVVDFDPHQLERRRLYLLGYRLGVRLASEIVVQTEEQVDLCLRSFARRPIVIGSLAPVGDRRAMPPEAFLWVGRLVWYKRPLDYIELAEALPEAQFWMVGVPSPLKNRREQHFAQEVSERARPVPNLEFLPPRPHSAICELMTRAVASVNTAEFEGMPNTLLEAWTRGVPALVLNHDPGGVVATHRLGGFAAGSRVMLAELAREQWRCRFERGDLSQRCRLYAERYHSPPVIAEHWARVVLPSDPASAVFATPSSEQTCAA
jgi:glycosyltransferase involved in cell wall biosynthesis